MMTGLIGFVLLVSPCGHDVCDYIPVTEHIYPTFAACEDMRGRLNKVRPAAVMSCGEVWRDSSGGNDEERQP